MSAEVFASRYFNSDTDSLVEECRYLGWPYTSADPDGEGSAAADNAAAAARAALAPFLAALPSRETPAGARYDHYAVLNALRAARRAEGSDLWQRYVFSRRLEHEASNQPGRVALELRRTRFDGGARQSVLRVPQPIDHPAQQSSGMEVIEAGREILSRRVLPGALDLTLADGEEPASVTVRYLARVYPEPPATAPVEATAEARVGRYCPFAVSPVLEQALTRALRASTAEERVRSVWRSFFEEFHCGHQYHHEVTDRATGRESSPDGSARTRWFDCVYGSWLLASLLERMEIPARVIGGLLLYTFGPAPHYWCEAKLDGRWVPLDLYNVDLADAGGPATGRGLGKRDAEDAEYAETQREEKRKFIFLEPCDGPGDEARWQDVFYQRLDARLRFERYPGAFGGFLGSVPWFIRRRLTEGGTEYSYCRVDSGDCIARDEWRLIAFTDE